MRRPGGSPVKTEGERSPVGQDPPKSYVDVKSERTHDGEEQHSAVETPAFFSKSPEAAAAVIVALVVVVSVLNSRVFLFLRRSGEGED